MGRNHLKHSCTDYYKDLRERDGKYVNGSHQAKGIAPLQVSVTKFRLHKDRALFNYLGNY